jgi:hypothetical protein
MVGLRVLVALVVVMMVVMREDGVFMIVEMVMLREAVVAIM